MNSPFPPREESPEKLRAMRDAVKRDIDRATAKRNRIESALTERKQHLSRLEARIAAYGEPRAMPALPALCSA